MKESFKEQKKILGRKLKEFKQSGLIKYRDYLLVEQKNAQGKSIKKAYLAYIEKEIKRADKKLAKLAEKLAE